MANNAQDAIPERIHSKIEFGNGCWTWLAAKHDAGYGLVQFDGRWTYAHRAVYELLRGPIPEGLTLDHLCRNVACVNPAHLEPVTYRENTLRGIGPAAVNAAKTHCKRGHAFTPENTYRPKTKYGYGRACRECSRLRGIKRREAARALKDENDG